MTGNNIEDLPQELAFLLSLIAVILPSLLQRPLAAPLLRQMQEPSFPCFKYLLSCEKHDQLFLPGQQGHSAVFWDGEKDERCVRVTCLERPTGG